MKLNNIIILGAGIAGTGLSFNLKRLGYTGKITLLDSNEIAANKAHSTKTILKKIKEEYSIPYYHKYDKIAFCNYDNPFFLIINLAIGGDWGGVEGIDTSIFPASFIIDYVRMHVKS